MKILASIVTNSYIKDMILYKMTIKEKSHINRTHTHPPAHTNIKAWFAHTHTHYLYLLFLKINLARNPSSDSCQITFAGDDPN